MGSQPSRSAQSPSDSSMLSVFPPEPSTRPKQQRQHHQQQQRRQSQQRRKPLPSKVSTTPTPLTGCSCGTAKRTISHRSHPNLRPASEGETARVLRNYSQCAVRSPTWEVASVEVVENAPLTARFRRRVAHLQACQDDPNRSGVPGWIMDTNVKARFHVFRQLEEFAAPHSVRAFPSVKILPLWSWVGADEISHVVEDGYELTRCGFREESVPAVVGGSSCGTGVMMSKEAEYAWRVLRTCSGGDAANDGEVGGGSEKGEAATEGEEEGGFLVLNWVALSSPFPVIREDSSKLRGKTTLPGYDGLYTPVVPCRQAYEEETYYQPLTLTAAATTTTTPMRAGLAEVEALPSPAFTEVCVFEAAQCFPAYVVRFVKSESASPRASVVGFQPALKTIPRSGVSNGGISEECLSDPAPAMVGTSKGGLESYPQGKLCEANLLRHEVRMLLDEMGRYEPTSCKT